MVGGLTDDHPEAVFHPSIPYTVPHRSASPQAGTRSMSVLGLTIRAITGVQLVGRADPVDVLVVLDKVEPFEVVVAYDRGKARNVRW